MATKIKVDPRTFKIINQHQTSAQSLPQLETTSTTNSSTSDSESYTSVNSVNNLKVIKLDTSEQTGGKIEQPINSQAQVKQLVSPVIVKPAPTSQSQFKNSYKYLSLNNNNNENNTASNSSKIDSLDTSQVEEQFENDQEEPNQEEPNQEEPKQEETKQEETKQEETTQDVFDLTQNKLHDVLYSIFTDVSGNNISENLQKFTKLFEAHNQIMEKMLNQLIIMNTNYKQIKVPDIVQSSTKQAGNIVDFRRQLEHLDPKSKNKD